MAIKKKSLNISRVAAEATQNYVAPKPLATNDAVRNKIVQETPAVKPLRRVCTIQKVHGAGEGGAHQVVVRAALHQFLKYHYKEGQGLDAEAMRIIEQYEDSVYQWV